MPLSRCRDFVLVTGWSIYLEVAGSSPSHAILYAGFELGFDHWGTICPLG